MDVDHKIEVAKVEEESASKDSFKAIKALTAKRKEKARSDKAFDKGNLLKGIDNKMLLKLVERTLPFKDLYAPPDHLSIPHNKLPYF